MTAGHSPLAIYIHWPFCASKCPYCDFNSFAELSLDESRMATGLISELEYFAQETKSRTISSIFFGGGTPSLMAPETVARLINAINSLWGSAGDLEITLEANPTSAEFGKFHGFAKAGVNRLSIGVQSFDDASLSFLGRNHCVSDAVSALQWANDNFPRTSFDLIYGLPRQTPKSWRDELELALDHASGHVSLYQLSVEPGTAFHRSGISEADEKTAARLFETTQVTLEEKGFTAYEISNYAKDGGQCRHNLAIWKGGDYIGVGPGAHGRISGHRGTTASHQTANPQAWLERVERSPGSATKRQILDPSQRLEEIVMLGLRLAEGIGRLRFSALTGSELEDVLACERLAMLQEGGFIVLDNDGIRATSAGRQRLNAVLAAILA